MLATVVGLVAFLYMNPLSQDTQEYKLSSRSVVDVQSIRIVRQDTVIELKKSANYWYLTEPLYARADPLKVDKVLDVLSAKSNIYFPLVDLDSFGLSNPNMQLVIDRETFNFGGLAPVTNQQYVTTGDNIYLISPRYAVVIPSQFVNFVSPVLLSETELLESIVWVDGSISRQGGEWVFSSKKSEQPLTQDEIKRWIGLWQSAKADSLTPGATTFDDRAIDADDTVITLTVQDEQVIYFKIQPHESDLILLRTDEGINYHFSSDAGKQLLDPHFVGTNVHLFDDD